MRCALKDALTFLLRDASDYGEHFSLASGALELVQTMEHLLLSFVANAAGVVYNQRGGFRGLDLRVTAVNKGSDDLLGIVRIHLAAEGLDVKRLLGHYVLIIGQDKASPLKPLRGLGVRSQESGVLRSALREVFVVGQKLRISSGSQFVEIHALPLALGGDTVRIKSVQ
jgi:hypothetical protein